MNTQKACCCFNVGKASSSKFDTALVITELYELTPDGMALIIFEGLTDCRTDPWFGHPLPTLFVFI